jgi:SET domain-containing protein
MLRSIGPPHTPFRLAVRRSPIHRLGVFARETIPAGRKVIEFAGERIGFQEARRRWNPRLNYLFAFDDKVVIDGSVGGSGAELINHCCLANLHTRCLRGHLLWAPSTQKLGRKNSRRDKAPPRSKPSVRRRRPRLPSVRAKAS